MSQHRQFVDIVPKIVFDEALHVCYFLTALTLVYC